MLESAYKIIDYTKDLRFEQFISDSKTVDAVIRNFEIIGEAANDCWSSSKIITGPLKA